MKLYRFFLLSILLATTALAQQGGVFNYLKLLPSTIPKTCNPGDMRVQTGTTILNMCGTLSATPTWQDVITGSTLGLTTDGILYGISGSQVASTGAGTATQILTSNGPGVAPTFQAAPATGVTSVGLSDGSTVAIYSITNSPITTSGTLTFSLKNQPANYVMAGPTSGGNTQPTFRAIVGADIPTLNQSTSGTASNITASSNSSLTTLSALSLPTSQLSGTISNAQLATAGAYTVKGNATGATASVVDGQTIMLGSPGFVATGIGSEITGSNSSFFQSILQNTNNGSTASTDFIVENDQGTNTTHYGNLGINSSGYTGSGSINLPGATYVLANSGELVLGTNTGNGIHMVVNNGSTDALIINQFGQLYTPALTGYLYGNASSPITASTTIPLASKVSGVLPIANGGTNTGNTLINNQLIVSSGGTIGELQAGQTVGYVLTSQGITYQPVWAAASGGMTNPMTTTGDMIYSSSGSTPARLAVGAGNSILTSNGTTPTWTGILSNVLYTSAAISGASTVISTTSYGTFSNSPSFTFTPNISGTYRVYAACPIDEAVTYSGFVRIINTSGSATLLSENPGTVYGSNATSGAEVTGYAQSTYTLNSGTSYVFDIQGKVSNISGGVELDASVISCYMYASLEAALTVGAASTVATITSAAISAASGSMYFADTTNNAITMTLPVPVNNASIEVKDSTGKFSTNAFTIAQHSSEKIDGTAASYILKGKWQDLKLISNGTDWFINTLPENLSARYTGAAVGSGELLGTALQSITFSTKDFDDNSNYSTTTGGYTCPTTGKYEVTAQAQITAATAIAAGSATLAVFNNGVLHSGQTVWFATAATKPVLPIVNALVNCTSGNTISVQAAIGGAPTTPSIQASSTYNFLWIRKLGN